MGWIDDVGDGFSWVKDKVEGGVKKGGEVAGDLIQAATAPVGVVYDLTTYALPGNQWGGADDEGFGNLLNHLGGRALDVADPLGLGYDSQIETGFSKTMQGLYTAYHETIDQPLSTAMIMASHIDNAGWGELLSGEAWAQAYSIAEDQTIGQSIVNAASEGNDFDPLDYYGKTRQITDGDGNVVDAPLTPFADSDFAKAHPVIANGLALGVDLAVSWYLDPAVLAGKGYGVVHEIRGMGKIPLADRATFANKIDSASAALDTRSLLHKAVAGKAPSARVDEFIEFAHANRLNGTEIRAIFPEMKNSAAGRQLSALLGDATKIEDATERGNAVRRILAVGAGDMTQIARLEAEAPQAENIVNTLKNIAKQSTVDLKAQALNKALVNDPAFRVKFNQQLAAPDTDADLARFIDGWSETLSRQYADDMTLLDSAGQLNYLPGAGSTRKLKAERGQAGLNLGTVERAHDKAAAKVAEGYRRFTGLDGSSTAVYQRGLYSVPLMVAMPFKYAAAAMPTKLIPAAVRNLKQVHLNGFVNLHQWNGALDQFDSMLRLGHVDDATRTSLLSEASRLPASGAEAAKQGIIDRVESAAIEGLGAKLSAQYGITIDAEFIRQSMLRGQMERRGGMAALEGGRRYASTTMQPGRLVSEETSAAFYERQQGLRAYRAKGEDALDQAYALGARADEAAMARVDWFDAPSGTPTYLPLVTPQLANRVALFDIERAAKLTSDTAYVARLAKHSQVYRAEVARMDELERALRTAKGSQARRMMKALDNQRKMVDNLLAVASGFNHSWKMSVLFRLGYPMRVIADDHLRIASKIGYSRFFFDNAPEAGRNFVYNKAWWGGSRKGEGKRLYALAQEERDNIAAQFGRTTRHTDEEWDELHALADVVRKGTADAASTRRLRELDPEGFMSEYLELRAQAARLQREIGGHRGAVTKWGADPANAEKLTAAQEKIAEKQGALDQVLMQLDGVADPTELRKQWAKADEALDMGVRAFRPEKRVVGSQGFDVAGGLKARGAYEGPGGAYREATSSSPAWETFVTDGEDSIYQTMASGHWQTVTPDHPGYYQLWANVLNHQIQNSPEFMSIIKGGVTSPQEYAAWLKKAENGHIRRRVPHYAADPEDWGGRLLAIVQDYIPTQALQDVVAAGRVTPTQLKRMFPPGTSRPSLHGQLADIQSGRNLGVRYFASGIQKAFKVLAEMPTDRLSRHPYFNAIYKHEVKTSAAEYARVKGGSFGQRDLDEIERIARKKALRELETTLWDVSAHSHGANVMRFISPFFAAHQEGLSRWWGIARNDPSVIRRWQLAFDAPRKATWVDENGQVQGLVVDENGHLVKPGEAISASHSIMVRVPFADKNNAVDRAIKDLGGGKYWRANENGFNIVLQSGVTNPGIGPFVTIPLENFVQKYADEKNLERFARSLNAYPPQSTGLLGIAGEQLTPGWMKYLIGNNSDASNAQMAQAFAQNWADGLTEWRLAHPGEEPTLAQVEEIKDRAMGSAHRDLFLRAVSGLTMFTPVRPGSKYAVVQDGLNRIREQAKREGQDYEWIQDTFLEKYGLEYEALLGVGRGTNPADLDGTPSEIAALKQHRALLNGLSNPLLTKLVIGPDSDALVASDSELGDESDAARAYLRGQRVTPTSGDTYYGTKDIDQIVQNSAARKGWIMYDQLVDYLQYEAEQKGLVSYEQDPELKAKRLAGLAYIKAEVPVFGEAWDSFKAETYTSMVDDIRRIASDRKLAADPLRSNEVYWLNQYLTLRDMVNAELQKRIAAGGAKSITASPNGENADLARTMRAGMDYILSQSPNLLRYGYNGIIERDPFLALPSEYDNQESE